MSKGFKSLRYRKELSRFFFWYLKDNKATQLHSNQIGKYQFTNPNSILYHKTTYQKLVPQNAITAKEQTKIRLSNDNKWNRFKVQLFDEIAQTHSKRGTNMLGSHYIMWTRLSIGPGIPGACPLNFKRLVCLVPIFKSSI